jgi:hypothetical protein
VRELTILLVVLLLLVGAPRLRRAAQELADHFRQSGAGRMPLYSAETTERQEAEFIPERLPRKRSPLALVVVLALVCGAVWWLTS